MSTAFPRSGAAEQIWVPWYFLWNHIQHVDLPPSPFQSTAMGVLFIRYTPNEFLPADASSFIYKSWMVSTGHAEVFNRLSQGGNRWE